MNNNENRTCSGCDSLAAQLAKALAERDALSGVIDAAATRLEHGGVVHARMLRKAASVARGDATT